MIPQNRQTHSQANYSGTSELWANENFLPRYNHDVVNKLSKYWKPEDKTLEFGAGLGTLASIWHSQYQSKPDCVEIDPALCAILKSRGFTVHTNIEDTQSQYDYIYTSNVLEHIEDDMQSMRTLFSSLNPNGYLAIYVPAFMVLFGKFDSDIGHYRRYNKKDIVQKLKSANFEIVETSYSDSIGFFAWLVNNLLFSKNNNDQKTEGVNLLKFYDTYIYPISQLMDKLGLKYFFGKNILVIARKNKIL